MKLGIVALLLAGIAAAQQPEAWAQVAALAPGAEIRVALTAGRTLRGRVHSVNADLLAIQANTRQETLPRAEVKRVQVKGKGHRARNALIGLGIGAGGGLAIGAAIDSRDKGSFDNFLPNAGKAIFTPLGAIIGAIVGVAIPTGGWHELYRGP